MRPSRVLFASSPVLVLAFVGCTDLPACEAGQSVTFDGEAWVCEDALPSCADGEALVQGADGWSCSAPLPACEDGEALTWVGGTWSCQAADELPVCQDAEVLVWNGTTWSCEAEESLPTCDPGSSLMWDGEAWTCSASGSLPTCTDGQVLLWAGDAYRCGVVVFGDAPFIDIARATLREFAASPDRFARQGVAANPNTPEDVLLALVDDPEADVRVALAKRVTASEALLLALADDDAFGVQRAVVGSPGATAPVLTAVYEGYVGQPACDLLSYFPTGATLTLSMKDLVAGSTWECERRQAAAWPGLSEATALALAADSGAEVRRTLARNPAAPPAALVQLGTRPELRELVMANPNTPAATLRAFVDDCTRSECRTLSINPSLSEEGLRALAVRWPDVAVDAPRMPADVLIALADDYPSRLVENPAAPAQALSVAYDEAGEELAYDIAQHPNLSADLVDALLDLDDRSVEYGLAENPETPASALTELADRAVARTEDDPDEAADLARSLARNPATPAAVLPDLVDLWAGEWVAIRDNVTEAILVSLEDTDCSPSFVIDFPTFAADPSEPPADVFWGQPEPLPAAQVAAARRTFTAASLDAALAADPSPCFRTGMLANPAATAGHVNAQTEIAPFLWPWLAQHPLANAASLALIGETSTSSAIRTSVAANPNTDEATLRALAVDVSAGVVQAVAGRPSAPLDVALELAYSRYTGVRSAAVANTVVPVE